MQAGIDECVIDIRVGFRCGCEVEEAPFLADLATVQRDECARRHGL